MTTRKIICENFSSQLDLIRLRFLGLMYQKINTEQLHPQHLPKPHIKWHTTKHVSLSPYFWLNINKISYSLWSTMVFLPVIQFALIFCLYLVHGSMNKQTWPVAMKSPRLEDQFWCLCGVWEESYSFVCIFASVDSTHWIWQATFHDLIVMNITEIASKKGVGCCWSWLNQWFLYMYPCLPSNNK